MSPQAKPMRLAFGRINQETNALSPVLTTMNDFRATHFVDDSAELLRRCTWWVMELDSMFRNAELSGFVQRAKKLGATCVPLVSAWAVPGGPLTRECFDVLVDGLCTRLKAAVDDGGIDGVFLSLHGAMNVQGLPLSDAETPESEIVRRVREVVGANTPIAVTLDLHGNLCRSLVESSTIIQGYQTNPHRDHAAVGDRCARLLVDTVAGKIKPVMAWRSLPMILGGGNTVDFLAPLRGIFSRMKELEKQPGILGTTLMTVHPWNNHKELGWATLVVADASAAAAADHAAEELARSAWDVRHQLPPAFASPDEAIVRARKRTFLRKTGVVVFADASDVVSAGSPGENSLLVKALVEAKDLVSMTTVRDPALIGELWPTKNPGDLVDVSLGAKLDPSRGAPLPLHAQIERKGSAHGMGRFLVLRVNSCSIVVVEGSAMAVRPLYYKTAGLNPMKADVVVVKNFFPFLMFFAPIMRDVVYVRTAGVTDFDASFVLNFNGAVHPRDRVDDWHPADQRRRFPAAATASPPTTTATTTAAKPTAARAEFQGIA